MKEKNRLLVFSLDKESDWLIKEIKKQSQKYNKIILVTTQDLEHNFLNLANLEIKHPREIVGLEIYKNRFKIVNDYIVNVSKKILSNEKIMNEFLIDGVNYWWFIPKQVLSLCISRKILLTLLIVIKTIEQYNPSYVMFDSTYSNSSLIKEVCQKKSVKYRTNISKKERTKKEINKLAINLFAGFNRRLDAKRISRWAKKEIEMIPKSGNKGKNIVFIAQENSNRLEYNIKGKLEKHDIYQKNIQIKLSELGDFNFYSIGLLNRAEDIRSFNEINREFENTEYIPLYYYYTRKLSRESARVRRNLHRILDNLFKSTDFVNAFSYENYSILDAFKFTFFRRFKTELVSGYENFQLFKETLTDIKPSIFVLYNEHSVFGRSAILAAKKMGIPIVALQHGNMSLASLDGYLITRDSICPETQEDLSAKCCHLSTIFSAYTNDDKKLLIKLGGYSEKRIIVTSCPRWDVILNKDCFNRKEFLNNLELNDEKKTVTILSQALPTIKNRDFFNREILEAIEKNHKDIQVIWKPHPREDEQEIREIIKKYMIKDIIVQKDLPLFDVLNVSDIVITIHSTAGLEALLFDKPLITLIPEGEKEAELFKDSSAVIKVVNQKELTEAINLIFYNEDTQKKLKKGREKLISGYIVFDGKASQRNAELILDKML